MEKTIAIRLLWYASVNNFISSNQMAFKGGHGTIDALLIFEHFITSALSTKNHSTALSLAFEKAYDRIGAHIVLKQLAKWKFGPKIYNFVKAFLSNRHFLVKANNKHSAKVKLYNGIPQGSPLSVILFIIAFDEINNILSKNKTIYHLAYADDVIIYSKSKSTTRVENNFTNALQEIQKWSEFSGASLSLSKCNLFHVCKKHSCSRPTLALNNINIEYTDSLKFLGLIFDRKLNFREHCLYMRR